MLYEIGQSPDVPVSRFFEGLPGNNETSHETPPLPVEERIEFIASAEGRRLIEGLMQLRLRVRGRVVSLISALREELALLDKNTERTDEPVPADRKTG